MVFVKLATQAEYDADLWKRLVDDDNITVEDLSLSPYVKTKLISVPSFIASPNMDVNDEGKTHNPPSVVCAAFAGGYGLFSLTSGELLRWCSKTKTFFSIHTFLPCGESSTVRNLFLGPGGHHGLVIFATGDVGYVSSMGNICSSLPSLKHMAITSVGWDMCNTPTPLTTYEILLGTQQGCIWNTEITNGKENNTNLLLNFSACVPVEALIILSGAGFTNKKKNDSFFPTSKNGRKKGLVDNIPTSVRENDQALTRILCVLVATSKKLYKFTGGPTYKDVFSRVACYGFCSETLPPEREAGMLSKMTLRKNYEDTFPRLNTSRFQPSVSQVIGYGGTNGIQYQTRKSVDVEDCLVFESPIDTPLTSLFLSSSFDIYGKRQSSTLPVTEAITQQMRPAMRQKGTSNCFLLWWLTGSGILISWISLTEHKEASVTNQMHNDSESISRSTSEGDVGRRALFNYDVDSRPLIFPFPPLIHDTKEILRNKCGPCFLRSRGGPKFELRTQKNDQTQYSAEIIPSWDKQNQTNECLGMALSTYHLFMLFNTHLAVVSRITKTQVQCILLPAVRYGAVCRLVSDNESGMIFLLTKRYLFQLFPTTESECVWIQRLASGDLAFPYQSLPVAHAVTRFLCWEYARSLMQSGDRVRGAEVVMNCNVPLEDLFLRFYKCQVTHSDLAGLIELIYNLVQKKHLTVKKNENVTAKKVLQLDSEVPINPELISALQLWELIELVHSLNESEFQIERLKQYRRRLNEKLRTSVSQTAVALDSTLNSLYPVNTSSHIFFDNISTEFQSIQKRLLSLISEDVASRRRHLALLHNRMKEFYLHSYELENEALFSFFEYLGRLDEKVYWATLLNHKEIQVVECICQDFPSHALIRLMENPSQPFSHSDASQDLDWNEKEWRERQLYLLSKFGVLLFAQNPTEFTAALFPSSNHTSTQLDSFSTYLREKIFFESGTADLFLPILLGVAASSSNYRTEVHQGEALKIVGILSSWLGAEQPTLKKNLLNQRFIASDPPHSNIPQKTSLNNISNLYVSILASMNTDTTDSQLVKYFSYLKSNIPNSFSSKLPLDLSFTLRFCIRKQHLQSVVFQLTLLRMYQNAVQVALGVGDPYLAKSVIDCIPENSEVFGLSFKKGLWKQIACSAKNILDVPNLISLLMESHGVFQIHDFLEFFPEPSVAAVYRDVLWKEYDECEKRIRHKQILIQDTQKTIDSVKLRIAQQKSKPIAEISQLKRQCFVCERPTDSDRFYVFPCSHILHAVCAHKLIYPFMDEKTKTEYCHAVESLRQTLLLFKIDEGDCVKFSEKDIKTSEKRRMLAEAEIQALRSREEAVDTFLASECPLCGDWIAKTIQVPFIPHSNSSYHPEQASSGSNDKPTDCQDLWALGNCPLDEKDTILEPQD